MAVVKFHMDVKIILKKQEAVRLTFPGFQTFYKMTVLKTSDRLRKRGKNDRSEDESMYQWSPEFF